jgi:ferredoxin-type protein NapH
MYGPYRKTVQILVFGIMFGIPLLNLYEIYAVTGTFYAVNIGGLGIADPVVILQAIFASGELTVPLLGAALFPVFIALLFGRIWCGWMCPFHLLADVAAWLRRRFRGKVSLLARDESLVVADSFKANTWRYGFLAAGTLAAGAISIPVLNYVSAPGILSTEAMILVKERMVSLEFSFIALLFLLELLILPRFWCRLFCPTGAFIAVFRVPFTLRVGTSIRTPKAPCCKENRCSGACPMGLAPFREGNNLLCTNCGLCIDACRAAEGSGRLRFQGFQAFDR